MHVLRDIARGTRLGRALQKTYSGKLSLRLEPGLHASVAAKAELAHKSINQWVSDILSQATGTSGTTC